MKFDLQCTPSTTTRLLDFNTRSSRLTARYMPEPVEYKECILTYHHSRDNGRDAADIVHGAGAAERLRRMSMSSSTQWRTSSLVSLKSFFSPHLVLTKETIMLTTPTQSSKSSILHSNSTHLPNMGLYYDTNGSTANLVRSVTSPICSKCLSRPVTHA